MGVIDASFEKELIAAAARHGKWIAAGGVVFDRWGRVALALQCNRALKLRWTLPKGRRDRGETIEAAALREVYEETGLRARVDGYIGQYAGKRRFIHYFHMVLERDDGVYDDETEEVRFVEPALARQLLRSRRDREVLVQAWRRWKRRHARALLSSAKAAPARQAGRSASGRRSARRAAG